MFSTLEIEMKIIGIYHIKGGVGKTATAVNLAYQAQQENKRVLIWDLDPQAAATFYFRVKPKVKKTKKILQGKKSIDLEKRIKATDFENLDILPADFGYRKMDQIFANKNKPALQLLRLLRPLSQDYDVIFLDCPPNISIVSENIFKAVDQLIIPTIPTTLSIRTLYQLLDFLKEKRLEHIQLCSFFSMVDQRKKMHLEIMETPLDKRVKVLKQFIPYAAIIEQMGIERAPVGFFAPHHPVSKAYRLLWKEIGYCYSLKQAGKF